MTAGRLQTQIIESVRTALTTQLVTGPSPHRTNTAERNVFQSLTLSSVQIYWSSNQPHKSDGKRLITLNNVELNWSE